MSFAFPSPEFDEAVSALCHGTASEDQVKSLNRLLLVDRAACDEYLIRLELHSRLASTPELFETGLEPKHLATLYQEINLEPTTAPASSESVFRARRVWWAFAVSICLAFVAFLTWPRPDAELTNGDTPAGATSAAVAMLNRTVHAEWNEGGDAPKLQAPLDPGWLRLESGLAEIVFYSGARVVLEGPVSFQLISSKEASCERGKLTAVVPAQARGFRIETPQGVVHDLGTEFALNVTAQETALHVFKGSVQFQPVDDPIPTDLSAGSGALIKPSSKAKLIAADRMSFRSLFSLGEMSEAADASRFEQWHLASDKLNLDSSLLVHFDFEYSDSSEWRLRNASSGGSMPASATIIGCRWNEGRWPSKSALEFQSVNDRVRLNVPGEYAALTLTAWVRVQGLDRKFNSLFMSEGFESQTVHWLIRNDGVLGLTVLGNRPGQHQIVASPPVISIDQFGMWLHLAAVLDGDTDRVQHYLNGRLVHEQPLRIRPPFRVGAAELGNWNADGFRGPDSLLIRNFSGAMDEFCLFGRALSEEEIETQYHDGEPLDQH